MIWREQISFYFVSDEWAAKSLCCARKRQELRFMIKVSSLDRNKKENLRNMAIVFLCIAGLYIIIQAVSGLYPFGSKSNLLWDQDVQYVDYFAYYKDVLLGKAHLGYSFSKSMGGSLMALFGYYLGCPLNVFVVFFSKAQIPLFLFILTAVKLGLSGMTIQYFFSKRFPALSQRMQIALAISYGLMQYVMIQLSNIMWLDGVILLPLLLLSVYRYVTENRKAGLFLCVLFSIAVNWYTGYMTGLFAACYFVYERVLSIEKKKGEWKRAFWDAVRFGIIMACGVLGSCFVFYPVVKGLQDGKQVYDPAIFDIQMNGSFTDIFRGFGLGSVIPGVALYCGLLALGFAAYYFLCGRAALKEKLISLAAALFMLVSCWLVPLECIWSGMRFAPSFRYRYSFVVIFLVLFLAAKGACEYEKKKEIWKLPAIFAGLCAVFVFFNYRNTYGQEHLLLTAGVLLVYGVLFFLSYYQEKIKLLIPMVLAAELVLNGVFTFRLQYQWNRDISEYQNYVSQSEKQIEAVKEMEDSTFYRMDTLTKRYDEESRCAAYLNEAMVYGYHGINHYSSTYNLGIQEMIRDIGYSRETDLAILSESSLPADSLFGVRYLLSKEAVPGYEKVESIPEANQKAVYYNPYALDLGVQTADTVYESPESGNPFEYQNQLYSNILGRDVELYKKAEIETSLADNVLNIRIPASASHDFLYGYVDSWIEGLVLDVDGEYRCNYATWLSYKIFSVGTGMKEHTVTLEQYTGTEEEMTPYFYYLDQSLFDEVIQELKGKEMTTEVFEDGHVIGSYTAEEEGSLLLTIPYDTGWTAVVNGEKAEIKEAADALMAVPVQAGENEIELKYHVPGAGTGILLTLTGILIFCGVCQVGKKRKKV